ncbi:MAG: hypothetical protein IJM30_03240 [Thermoguttaceae bacterium]|nr:hypothetical protein [Thermoguttaceae bacterium]
MSRFFRSLVFVALALVCARVNSFAATAIVSLDGAWRIRTDPDNVGKAKNWFEAPLANSGETSEISVPGVIQEVFRTYHGLVWYEREFKTPENPNPDGRALLRFWQAEYRADVWLNGVYLGFHEGGEEAFELETTGALKPAGETNRLTVRVLNASDEPIDGISMANIPRRNNTNAIVPGCGYASGGLVDSVELELVPGVRIADEHLVPNWKTGEIEARLEIDNATGAPWKGALALAAVSCDGGEFSPETRVDAEVPAGRSTLVAKTIVPDFKLWNLNDPNLYSVVATLSDQSGATLERKGATCGFRDFRFENGYFRLNGKRIYLKCSHSGSDSPITHRLPLDPDLYRKDIITCKTMGFNMIRYIAGMPRRFQLDLCDRIGFLVYDECLAGWQYESCPERPARYEAQTLGMIRRDRNHPSVVIWGLLNETFDSQLVLQAARLLDKVRDLDPDGVVFLNSGSFDAFAKSAPITANYAIWRRDGGAFMPGVIKNETSESFFFDGTQWESKTLFLHPGDVDREYVALRWAAPKDCVCDLTARFNDVVVHGSATVDLRLVKETAEGRTELWNGRLNLEGAGKSAAISTQSEKGAQLIDKSALEFKKGESLSLVVGIGDGDGHGDTTAVDFKITCDDGTVFDAREDFSSERNPSGAWSYGWLPSGESPNLDEFSLFDLGQKTLRVEPIGRFANPGSRVWQNELADTHPYKPVPHTAAIINELRTHSKDGLPVFLSEYGIGSAVDLFRLTRYYEQYGATDAADALHYRWRLDQFNADWNRWKLDEVFATQEDFFRQAIALMGEQRRLGINAIRANANVIAHSVTGTHDQGISGEGLTTIFRELKPGTVDAMAEVFAPLRFSAFVEPQSAVSGGKVRAEAVLVNEDVLAPGDYPVRLVVVGPNGERFFDETRTLTIPEPDPGQEVPFVQPAFEFEVEIPRGTPTGECRFFVETQERAAAFGSERFFTFNRDEFPSVGDGNIYVWGDDADLLAKLDAIGIPAKPFTNESGEPVKVEPGDRLLVGKTTNRGSEAEFAKLFELVSAGTSVVFLSTDVFAEGDEPTRYMPFKQKGVVERLPNWLYHKDDWNRRDPAFDGLPSGQVVDYVFYRDVVPQATFRNQVPEPDVAIAGGFSTQMGYGAGLSLASWKIGEGEMILSTWLVQESLPNPVAERILRNLLIKANVNANR